VRRGKTVEAITRYKDVMGTTGAEAQAAVEALAKQLRSKLLGAESGTSLFSLLSSLFLLSVDREVLVVR
jgi:hypothetical protein